jgi:hypothetical protein
MCFGLPNTDGFGNTNKTQYSGQGSQKSPTGFPVGLFHLRPK